MDTEQSLKKSALHGSRAILLPVRPERASRTGSPSADGLQADNQSLWIQSNPSQVNPAGVLTNPDLLAEQRQELAIQINRDYGNRSLLKALFPGLVQREDDPDIPNPLQAGKKPGTAGAGSGGSGPGKIQNATEQVYNVSGATLPDIASQLTPFGGFGAQTSAPLTIKSNVAPQKQADGTFKVQVQWVIKGATVSLPRWTDYGKSCPAAQREWDRFMGQTRQHEQQAHVDMANNFVNSLGEEDTVITGASIADLQANLGAKQQELGQRLQAKHDACDHGASIDAILHTERGTCQEE